MAAASDPDFGQNTREGLVPGDLDAQVRVADHRGVDAGARPCALDVDPSRSSQLWRADGEVSGRDPKPFDAGLTPAVNLTNRDIAWRARFQKSR